MRDWQPYVREHLGSLQLDAVREASIVAELAQQLEQAERAGRDPEQEIRDWTALRRKIERAAAAPSERWAAASDLARDLRHALRTWRRAPGFAVIAVLTLALGIGANTAMFSWVNAELLAALPYHDAGRLVVLNEWANGRRVSVSYPEYVSWQADNARAKGSFSALAWVQWMGFDLEGPAGPEVINAADVSGNYFATLGVMPVLGRGFGPEADTGGAPQEAVITWKLAEQQFGTASAALEKPLALDQHAYTVVGVLPPAFREQNQTDIFVPDGLELKDNADRGDRGDAAVIGRLAPGASLEAAAAQMRGEMERLAASYPDDLNVGSVMAPLRAAFVGNDAAMLWMLLGAVGLVLLIACANVANLMLTRTAARQQEWSIRAALGAGRGRLIRQLMAESLALGMAGVAIGLLIAEAGMRGLAALMPVAANEVVTLSLSWAVLGFTAAIALVAIVLFGLGPAFSAARAQAAGRGNAGLGWRRRREVLMVAEVALALILTAAAGLTLKSFAKLMAVNPGFQPDHIVTLSRRLQGTQYQNDATVRGFEQKALAKMAALPGVEAAAIGTDLPLTGDHSRTDMNIVGRPLPQRGHYPHPDLHYISPGYLPALGLPLLAGRNFNASDGPTTRPVVLISEQFAAKYWPHADDALGQQLCCGNHNLPFTIVGIVANTKQYGLDAPENIEVYLPFTQYPPGHPTFVLRTRVPPLSVAPAASAIFHNLDPRLPRPEVQTMDQILSQSVGQPQAMLWMLAIFGGLALGLAAIGIYGVVSYATERRTAEIGIRMALGADRGAVARMIGGQTLRLVAVGIGLGVVAVLAFGGALAPLLFQTSTHDPLVLGVAAVVLLATGALGCAVPVRRATRVDPMTALRQD